MDAQKPPAASIAAEKSQPHISSNDAQKPPAASSTDDVGALSLHADVIANRSPDITKDVNHGELSGHVHESHTHQHDIANSLPNIAKDVNHGELSEHVQDSHVHQNIDFVKHVHDSHVHQHIDFSGMFMIVAVVNIWVLTSMLRIPMNLYGF